MVRKSKNGSDSGLGSAPPDLRKWPARLVRTAAASVALALPVANAAAAASPAAAATCYRVTATINVGNSPEGVAADPRTGTVYVAKSRVLRRLREELAGLLD